RRSRVLMRIQMLLQRGRKFSPFAARAPLAVSAVVIIGFAVAGALAPHWIAFAQRLEFEVASVKRNPANCPTHVAQRRSGDVVMMHNTQPYSIIYYAYHLSGSYQVEGYTRLPEGWNWFDIDARARRDATDDEIRLMFQTLLSDRFKLRVHRQTK